MCGEMIISDEMERFLARPGVAEHIRKTSPEPAQANPDDPAYKAFRKMMQDQAIVEATSSLLDPLPLRMRALQS